MNAIITIGETIYDIIFRNGQPVAARPGGSMLNSAVSLGRCGLTVKMITELGGDKIGKIILDFLAENGVETSYIKPVSGFRTPVSLAFLNEEGKAEYSFYKNYPGERLSIDWPELKKGDVVLFGSFYSLDFSVREKIIPFIRKAKENGSLIVYDPNIRKNHLQEIRSLMGCIEENLSLADIVRGSDEDFENLFGLNDTALIYDQINRAGCRALVITRGAEGAELITSEHRLRLPAKEIEIVSTIGAGDAFNAGIIFGIIHEGITVDDLVHIKEDSWLQLLNFGTNFAGNVCGSFDNYVSAGFSTM